jgi:hypothetical protein
MSAEPLIADPWADAPKPGLYKGVAYETYARWNAANHSLLRHFGRSAAHAHYRLTHPDEGNEEQQRGHTTHVAILEPERFVAEYVAAPKIDKRTNVGKAEWAEFQATYSGKVIVPAEEYNLAGSMAAAVWAHPTAAELLRGGINEVSLSWRDADTGVPCKSRIDHLGMAGEWSAIVDLKTSRNAARRSFERDLHSYGYHQQGAMYIDGADALSPRPRKFVFVVVENDPPHCVAVYELDEEAIALGRDDYKKHLRMYAEAVTTGHWPGYAEGMDYVSLPAWAFRAVEGA